MIAKTLISRPLPNRRESFLSYQIRLARANGYEDRQLKSLTKSYGAPMRSFDLEERLRIREVFEYLTGHSITLFDPWAWANDYKQMIDYMRIKFCPKCYEDLPVIESHWHLRNSLICTKHICYMVDTCDVCGEKLTVDSFIKRECLCGHSLSSIAVKPWPSETNIRVFANNDALNSSTVNSTLSDLYREFIGLQPFYLLCHARANAYRFSSKRVDLKQLADLKAKADRLAFDQNLGCISLIREIHECGNTSEFQKTFTAFVGKSEFKRFNDLLKLIFLSKADQFTGMKVTLRFLERVFSVGLDQLNARIRADSSIRFASSAGGGLIDASDVPKLFKHESA